MMNGVRVAMGPRECATLSFRFRLDARSLRGRAVWGFTNRRHGVSGLFRQEDHNA